jgi:asparagine synthase (glutamine-hydrolysing)
LKQEIETGKMWQAEIRSGYLREIMVPQALPGSDPFREDQLVAGLLALADIPPYLRFYHIPDSGCWLFAADPVRGKPLFYTIRGLLLIISDVADEVIRDQHVSIDPYSELEFLSAGYTSGGDTLYLELKMLQAGEYLLVNETGIHTGFYYNGLAAITPEQPFPDLKKELASLMEEVFRNLIYKLDQRLAVISLSGGFDSRLIAYWLVKLGYSRIFCFTYGRKGNAEVENARKTCDALKLDWLFIDYEEQPLFDYLDTRDFNFYFPWMANYSSMFFMQDYFAIRYLKQNSLVPDDAVFLPGHSGDFIAGSHLTEKLGNRLTRDQLAREIVLKHFNLLAISGRERNTLRQRIAKNLPTGFLPHTIYEDWELKERQAKFIVNSARVYSFFGFDYLLPLWDMKLIDFFKKVPFEFKLQRKLYRELLRELFSEYRIYFEKEIILTETQYKSHRVKQYILSIFPSLIRFRKIPVRDTLCYNEITSGMEVELRRKPVSLRKVYGYNGKIVQWYLAKIRK